MINTHIQSESFDRDEGKRNVQMMEEELRTMILDYLQKGFLDNIIDMFRHDRNLYPLVIDMIKDDRIRVRLGCVALVEELAKTSKEEFAGIVPEISALLKDPNPTLRGDAAYLLGIIGLVSALPALLDASDDEDMNVRETVTESIQHIRSINATKEFAL